MTKSAFPPDFFQKILDQAMVSAGELTKQFVEAIWSSLKPHWPYLAIGLFVLLFILTIKAMLGKWGALGSVLYHIIFLVLLGISVLIWGWKILYNPLFYLISFVIYRLAYMLVGLILRKFRR